MVRACGVCTRSTRLPAGIPGADQQASNQQASNQQTVPTYGRALTFLKRLFGGCHRRIGSGSAQGGDLGGRQPAITRVDAGPFVAEQATDQGETDLIERAVVHRDGLLGSDLAHPVDQVTDA